MPAYPELAGKVAIVTGAGREGGLGEAIAKRLAQEGARVLLHDLGMAAGETAPEHGVGQRDELEAVAESIRRAGGECITYTGDMLVEADVEGMVKAAVAKWGKLDILVNNAGVGYLVGPVTEMSQQHWDTVIGVNLRGCFFGIKHAAAQMLKQGGSGRIVSIASQAAKSGVGLMTAYSASKHGLIGLTRSAAIELGSKGITVNAVCPNHVATPLGVWQRENLSTKMRGISMDEYWERFRAKNPIGRPGVPEDTANIVTFLCSEAAAYVTGEAWNVTGGEETH